LGIGSLLRRHWVEVLWGAFAAANVAVIVTLANWETIPFHLIWVSLTVLYGFRVWSPDVTGLVLLGVSAFTGTALAFAVARSGRGFDEVAEVPLMAAMFLAMVWHARRRQSAVEEAQRMAEAEHALLERQREFVRDASHELRTPITVARGHAELLRVATTDPQALEDLEVILDELARLSRLSERLLVLASAEHPGFLSLRPVDVSGLVGEAFRRWSSTAPRAWRSDVEVQGTLRADEDRLRDAMDALVENAIKATGAGDVVTIGARLRGKQLVLQVEDEGQGIDPAQLPSLFERFSRVDAPRTRDGGGTGLGLSIVKAIAEAHRGTVEVESNLGSGAAFRIVLPGFRPSVVRPDAPAPVS
jgi:two-component system OmpR family sensor kinase